MLSIQKFFVLTLFLYTLPALCQSEQIKEQSLFKRVRAQFHAKVNDGDFFAYYDLKDRVRILSELSQAIKETYAPLILKIRTLDIDPRQILESALEAERNIADATNSLEMAQANLDFFDRMQALVARFQDTHFSVNSRIPAASVLLPFDLASSGDSFFIVDRSPELLAYLDLDLPGIKQAFEFGNEVLEIDGRSPREWISELEKFISGSSPAFRKSEAIKAITFRSNAFPRQSHAKIKLIDSNKNIRIFSIPWFRDNPRRDDQAFLFKRRGFVDRTMLGLRWNQETEKWSKEGLSWDNGNYSNKTPQLSERKRYFSDSGALGAQTGYIARENGRAIGWLQILTFNSDKLTDQNSKAAPFFDPIISFVKELKAKEIPLILDLRKNGGGNGNYPSELLSILSEFGKMYPGKTTSFPTNLYSTQVFDDSAGDSQFVQEIGNSVSIQQIKELLHEARNENQPSTRAISTGNISAHQEIGGYQQNVIALISPDCISACDITAALLKTSRRATIIGTHSNGTGAGFRSTGNMDSVWSDSLRVMKSEIPNYLFGKPKLNNYQLILSYEDASELNLENRPTEADVQYNSTVNDMLKAAPDLTAKIIEEIDKP